MSLRIMSRVWDHSRASGADLLLLLAIADSAHDDGLAYPTVDVLAHKARLSRRGVQTAQRRLVEHGELVVEKRPGRYATNAYRVLCGQSGEGRTACAPDAEGCKWRHSRGARRAPSTTEQPKPVKDHTKTGARAQGPDCPVHNNGDGETRERIGRVRNEIGAGAEPMIILATSGLSGLAARDLAKRWPSRVLPCVRHALAYAERELARGHGIRNLPGLIRTAIEKGYGLKGRGNLPVGAAA